MVNSKKNNAETNLDESKLRVLFVKWNEFVIGYLLKDEDCGYLFKYDSGYVYDISPGFQLEYFLCKRYAVDLGHIDIHQHYVK